MTRWRIALHALDRTGPPMLARAFVEWIVANRREVELEIVAFRGGELLDEFVRLAPTHVLLDPSEHWDHRAPDPGRVREIGRRAHGLGEVDATLLVSVSAGQVLPYLPPSSSPVAAWVVEHGEDLHWVDGPLDLAGRVSTWFAGSEGTRVELADRFGIGARTEGLGAERVAVIPEFIATPSAAPEGMVSNCRAALGARPDEVIVLGAGIATPRKAPDLFVEVAALCARRGEDRFRFVWLGGERDPMFAAVRAEIDRLDLDNVRLMGSVVDIDPWCAAADVFLHPARLDAFPLVCLHAAVQGTPVVGFSGAGGLVEMFGDGFRGAPFPDVAGLADAVTALADPAERGALGRTQCGAVLERFTSRWAASTMFEALSAVSDRPAITAGDHTATGGSAR